MKNILPLLLFHAKTHKLQASGQEDITFQFSTLSQKFRKAQARSRLGNESQPDFVYLQRNRQSA